jgi:[ribosomal protein S5]-alanine N-acetyltransferase
MNSNKLFIPQLTHNIKREFNYRKMKLDSERLTYTSFTKKEITGYAQLVMNEDVMKFITGKPLTQEESDARFIKNIIAVNEQHPDAGYFSVRIKEDNTFIGLAKLVYISPSEAEIGYMLLPGFWGMKYASEMVQCLINYSVTILKLKTLIAIVDPANPGSIKVLTNHGFNLFNTGYIEGLPAGYYRLKLQG